MGVLVFVMVTIVLALLAGFVYLLYIPFKRYLIKRGKLTLMRSGQINFYYVMLVFLASIYLTIDAFYPGESFYEGEYKWVTMRDIPSSAEFVRKSASYPDFHGDYCSSSQIKLSTVHYKSLLEELKRDSALTSTNEMTYFVEFDYTIADKDKHRIKIGFERAIPGEDDHYLYIGFYDDDHTIFVNVCVT